MKLERHHFTRIEVTATCDQRKITVGELRMAATMLGDPDPYPGQPSEDIAKIVVTNPRIYIEGELKIKPLEEIEMEIQGQPWIGRAEVITERQSCCHTIYTIMAWLYPKE